MWCKGCEERLCEAHAPMEYVSLDDETFCCELCYLQHATQTTRMQAIQTFIERPRNG